MDNDNRVSLASKNFARRCVMLYNFLCTQKQDGTQSISLQLIEAHKAAIQAPA